MEWVALTIFVLTYLGLAAGRIPGLAVDRTGFAILGAVAFLATGLVSLEQAIASMDVPTLSLLFGMMLLSVQYQRSGLYALIGNRIAASKSPRTIMLGAIIASAMLSAVLTNDVVCFALVPLIAPALMSSRIDPLPYLVAIACASNIGSALTPIGNPQNILIAQSMKLEFLPFVLACALPVLASLVFLYVFMLRHIRPKEAASGAADTIRISASSFPSVSAAPLQPINRFEAGKAVVLTVAAITLFLVPSVPAWLTALGIAGVVLLSRKAASRDLLTLVDWPLLALFMGLFVVVRGLELSGWTHSISSTMAASGAPLDSAGVYMPVAFVLSNAVSNVPAVMLLLPFVGQDAPTGHALALMSTFAGNALLVGSIANIIVAEQAKRLGLEFGFWQHLRIGLPVALVSGAFAVLTHLLMG